MTFTLHIFESEFKEIKDFVSRYPNIETGGDLFGLWKASGDPVVQLIIGPGRNCRRTSVSFHQDTDYLARVGTFVNTNFMLCHIGSWHSHHQLSLTQPSAGDRSTVCNNFPKGLKRYIMIIANITRGGSSRHSVDIHPYMFTNEGHVCKQGKVSIISWGNPFRDLGFVLNQIANGAELPPATKEAYSSRAPLEYHDRPSTRSKPISAAPVQAFNTNQSHFPSKVDRNLKQPSTSRYFHDEPTPMRQNYVSNNSTPEPMDVDPPDYRMVNQQQSTKSQHRATESNDTRQLTQWYETEEGGAILKEIHEKINTTMSDNISYSRDQVLKNLTMEFTHNNQMWTINFPRLFNNEPATIRNPLNGKSVLSRSVVEDIRQACCCSKCQSKNTYRQHSPSKDNHPLSPPKRDHSPTRAIQSPPHSHSKNVRSPKKDLLSPSKEVHRASRRGRFSPYGKPPHSRSPPQHWYDTDIGKNIVQQIKHSIETYLKTDRNVGRVETMTRVTSKHKQLTFDHNYQRWIIEFVSSKKDHVELKMERNKQQKFVAILPPPYDVVGVLKKHCPCIRCKSTRRSPSAGQRRQGSALTRPNSRHVDHVRARSPTRAASTSKFFATEEGEEKFKRIFTQVDSLFGGKVEMVRLGDSKDIEIKFEHNRKQWKITFPFMFPQARPTLEYAYMYNYQTMHEFYPVSVSNANVLSAIRKDCRCPACKRYR